MDKRLPNLEDRIGLERLNGGDYCPGSNRICYASNQSGGVVLKNLATGVEQTIPAKAPGAAQFTPDGSAVLFLAAGNGGRQLFRYDFDGGEARQITSFSGPILEPILSPDGKKVLFVSPHSTGTPEKKAHSDEAIVIEEFGYKFDGRGFIRPDAHMQVYCADTETGEVTALTGGKDDWFQANWLLDSRRVVCISAKDRAKDEQLGFDLFLLDSEHPQAEPLRISQGYNLVSYPNPTRPVCSPDGAYVYMGVMDPEADLKKGYPEIYFYRFPTEGGEPERIFWPDADCFQCVQFPYNAGCGSGFDKVQRSEDGKELFFLSGWKGQTRLYRLPLEGDGHAIPVLGGKRVCHGLGRIREGKMLLACSEPDRPEYYCLLNLADGTLSEPVVQSNRKLLEEVCFSPAEDFFFRTLDGESEVQGWVMPPQERVDGRKYPTILYVHGGPHPFYTWGFTMEHQLLTARGFGVIFCNPRGSSGYGLTHQNMARATDGSAYTDCLQFVEEAVRRYDWIDPDRIGVTGGSYGGWMTNYMATHSKRFGAYVSQRSVVNDLIGYASSDMQGSSKEYKSFEEFMVNQLKASPVCYAERVDRPFLILHGMEDYRTPVYGAHQLYTALKDLHPELPVRMVLFPHVGHDQPEDPGQLRIYFEELAGWFERYL